MRFTARLALLAVVLSLLGVAAYAQITPSADAYTNSAAPTTNYGSNVLLYVNGATETTYIQFNLATIPSSADVSQATLKLYVNSVTTAGSFNVDYVNGTWSESTITHNLAPALGGTIASNVPITTADKNQYILIDITAAVQAWLSGSQTNDGIALVANGTFNASFDSKENTTTSHPAEVDVVLAGGGTLTGVTTASTSGLQGGGTSGTLNLSLTTACASGQVLQWNGSSWGCASVGTGTVTSVTAGAGLTGGTITTSGTLSIDTTKVPLLAANNTFTGNEVVNGSFEVTNSSNYQPFLVQSASTFGTWLELSNTSTNGQTWNILSAGGANAEGAGNLGITNLHGGTIWLEGPVNSGPLNIGSGVLHVGGATAPTTTAQGAYLGWNALTGGTGETDFINNEGGGSGGFAFMNTPSSGNPKSTLMFISGGGNVGIGTTSPVYPLQVNAPSETTPGIWGVGGGGGSQEVVGGSGLIGTGGNETGVASLAGTGVTAYGGLATGAASSGGYGVIAYGGTGEENAPLGGIGVYGIGGGGLSGADGGTGIAAYGGSAGGTGRGGDGIDAFPGSPVDLTYAGYFDGNVLITGGISNSSSSFKIDHPLDPANKYLYHSSVESPDMKNIYDGVATLDASGEAVIEMPDWFGTLNRDFRYQLTCIGGFAPVYVAEELANNQFKIGGGHAGMKVSWQITGIRQDAWANAHRIPVEQVKDSREQGFYIHPELYSAPDDKGIAWARYPDMMKRMKTMKEKTAGASSK